jgi:hypothetical protein
MKISVSPKLHVIAFKRHGKKSKSAPSNVHGLIEFLTSLSISGPNTTNPTNATIVDIGVLKNEINDRIISADMSYFMRFLQSYQVVEIDIDTFYNIGKYASKPLYTILRNSNIFESYFEDELYVDTLFEGISVSDNYPLLQHLIESNDSCNITVRKLYQYGLCFIEKKAFNSMQCAMSIITSSYCRLLKEQQNNVFSLLNMLLNKGIELYDSKMVTIIHGAIKTIKMIDSNALKQEIVCDMDIL